MEKLFLAADSGGSKTIWRLINTNGKIVFECSTDGLGAIKAGLLPIKETVLEAKEKIDKVGNPEGIFLSLGGPNVDEVINALNNAWNGVKIQVERESRGDAILYAASFLGCSGVVMCGTGSVAVGNTKSGRCYCGGWGPIYGDGGSGGGLGTEALKLYLKHFDNLENIGSIAQIFSFLSEGLNVSTFEGRMAMKDRVTALSRKEIAALTPKIYNSALKGDKTALELYKKFAKEIALMAYNVSDNSENTKVLLCGGFFNNSPLLLKLCEQEFAGLSKGKLFYSPKFAPILGAELSVLKNSSLEITDEIFNNIFKNAKEI
ncbi:MAG: hypothetical protein E7560_04415 [Ruminococcaceae bacterium]|nr:hypothetical protein [Oscillospiraceae bacterium]